MKKLNGFTIEEWMHAEALAGIQRILPKPKGSVTVNDYSIETGLSNAQARKRLHLLANQGFATKQRWINGRNGACFVYILKPKKEWPKR